MSLKDALTRVVAVLAPWTHLASCPSFCKHAFKQEMVVCSPEDSSTDTMSWYVAARITRVRYGDWRFRRTRSIQAYQVICTHHAESKSITTVSVKSVKQISLVEHVSNLCSNLDQSHVGVLAHTGHPTRMAAIRVEND